MPNDQTRFIKRRQRKPSLDRFAQVAWAVFALSVSGILIFSGGGHPPPIVLLPLVIVIWIVGHIAIWGIAALAAHGRRYGPVAQRERPWPTGLKLALIGTAIGAFVGILQACGTVFLGKLYPYRDATLWTTMMTVWLFHGACFLGLLLRRPWSRMLSTLVVFGWALLSIWQIADHLLRGQRVDIAGLMILGTATVFLILFGVYLATSSSVKSFLNAQHT